MTGDRVPAHRVAVLGLGVIGGSLARVLAERAPGTTVIGWSPSIGEREQALEEGVVHAAPTAWEDAVEEANVVVLAMPIEACLRVLPEMSGLTGPDTTLTDVASLKAPLMRAARTSGITDRWVGAHPMAGSEGSGFRHARATLFDGARVWITTDGAGDPHVERVRALWRAAGAEPRDIDAEEHDRSMVLVSHLPQLVANALAAELARRGVETDTMGPGGRDMTRLAASHPGMWLDLFLHAPEGLPAALRGVAGTLEGAAGALESGDLARLEALMRETRTWKEEA